ncbi:MAG: GatB/YqeY domain-containing protein [Ignavibacteriales bacterium]|nr:GatB/YqeY domain-containing protein [Ignavibacteriales bacterium]
MNLKDKITEDLKSAMKSGEKLRIETLRMLRAQILEFEKSGMNRAMTDDDDMKILLSSVKKRKESIEQYEKAGRKELADQELKEIEIIQAYLPKQMTKEEAEIVIVKVIAEVGATSVKDFGKVMPAVMKELKGKVDGKIINEIVKQKLT